MNTSNYPLTLFFDGRCPLCRREMASLRHRDTAHRLRFEDVRDPAFELPAGTTMAALLEAIHARTAEGRLVVGVETLQLAYDAIGLGWLLAPTRWPLLRGVSERAYSWVARHRFALPGWLGLAFVVPSGRDAHCDDTTCHL